MLVGYIHEKCSPSECIGFDFNNACCQVMKDSLILFSKILTFMAIIFYRYLLLFKMRNAFMLREDFWSFFLPLWSMLFSLLTQTVFVYSPGKNTVNYNLCMGSFPSKYHGEPVKKNIFILLVGVFCVIANTVVLIKTLIYKVKVCNNLFLAP